MATKELTSGMRHVTLRDEIPSRPLVSRHLRRVQPLLVGSLLFLASHAMVQAQEYPEPVYTCVEGSSGEPLPIAYSGHTSGCQISPATDEDAFSFYGTVGEKVRLILYTSSNSLDPCLEVLDPDLHRIGYDCCVGACSLELVLNLPATGIYRVFVSDDGFNTTGPYLLQLERVPPSYCAKNQPYGMTITYTVNPQTDHDYGSFFGRAGSLIRFIVATTSNSLDPDITVYDPTGTALFHQSCVGACSFQRDLTLAVSGVYLLELHDAGFNNTASATISINCRSGDCPGDCYVKNLIFTTKSDIKWDCVGDAGASYDVVKGDLVVLRTGGGDFTPAITECLMSATSDCGSSGSSDFASPDLGGGFFYVARAASSNGDVFPYDNYSWGPAQLCGETPEINASPYACP